MNIVTYATNEESAQAIASTNDYDQPRRLALDIFKSSKAPANAGLRPVLVCSHHGHPHNLLVTHPNLRFIFMVVLGEWVSSWLLGGVVLRV